MYIYYTHLLIHKKQMYFKSLKNKIIINDSTVFLTLFCISAKKNINLYRSVTPGGDEFKKKKTCFNT